MSAPKGRWGCGWGLPPPPFAGLILVPEGPRTYSPPFGPRHMVRPLPSFWPVLSVFCAAAGRPRGAGVLAALAQESQCFTFARGVATACVCVGILVYARGKAAAGAATKAVPAGVEAA